MKKTTSIVLWLIVLAAWCGLSKLAHYMITMYYSNLAPSQFEDDSTYGKMQLASSAHTVTTVIFVAVVLFLVFKIIKIWSRGMGNTDQAKE